MTDTGSRMTPDQFARNGAKAIEAYFHARGATPTTKGDGRYTIYIPGGDGTANLQLALASTPAARGILARTKARRFIAHTDWPRALLLINQWNRSSPLPHVTLATRGTDDKAIGFFLVEGFLPPPSTPDPEQVNRFIETVVAGSRQFWSSRSIRQITKALPNPTATDDRPSPEPVADQA